VSICDTWFSCGKIGGPPLRFCVVFRLHALAAIGLLTPLYYNRLFLNTHLVAQTLRKVCVYRALLRVRFRFVDWKFKHHNNARLTWHNAIGSVLVAAMQWKCFWAEEVPSSSSVRHTLITWNNNYCRIGLTIAEIPPFNLFIQLDSIRRKQGVYVFWLRPMSVNVHHNDELKNTSK
jgi:hypothetical protein